MRLANIQEKFDLNDQEVELVECCIGAYSNDMSFCVLVSRIWNAIRHIFGESDWQRAQSALSERLFSDVSEEVGTPLIDSFAVFAEYPVSRGASASALSEFILRYLVTQATIERHENQHLISPAIWNRDNFSNLEAEE